jgi:predicted transcriptional regulator
MEVKNKNVKSTQLKNMITKCLYFDKAMSCAELSELFDKSIPSIAKAVNELIDEGFVVEQGYAPSSGGRRPLMYAINANAMCISWLLLWTSFQPAFSWLICRTSRLPKW